MYYCIAEKKEDTSEWIPGPIVEVCIIVSTTVIEKNTPHAQP